MAWGIFGGRKPEIQVGVDGNYFIPLGFGSVKDKYGAADRLAIMKRVALAQSVIGIRSEVFANAVPYITDAPNGKGNDSNSLKADNLRERLDQANFIMSGAQWYVQKEIFKCLFGYCFTLLIRTGGKITAMYNIPPSMLSVMWTGKQYYQSKLSQICRIRIIGADRDIDVDNDLILWNDRNIGLNTEYPFLAASRLEALIPEVNLAHFLSEAENAVVTQRGAMGILSRADENLPTGIFKEGRERLEKELQEQYGLASSQSKIIATDLNMKWLPMNWPTKDLMLPEFDELTSKKFCGVYDVPYYLLPISGQSTYENVTRSEIQLYQRVALPTSRGDAAVLARAFGLAPNEYLHFDYSDVYVLSEDLSQRATALSSASSAVVNLYNSGLMTLNEARGELAYYTDIDPSKPDGNYKSANIVPNGNKNNGGE